MAKFKNTTFREGYKPTFSEFAKSHQTVIAIDDLENAFEALTGKKPTKTELKVLEKLKDGDTSSTASDSTVDGSKSSD